MTTKLNNIRDNSGATFDKSRVGRGIGSGKGKTAGRGHKGQLSRGSGKVHPGFEGGQNPLYRRLPMKGFNNSLFTKTYVIINIGQLQGLVDAGKLKDGADVSIETLQAAGFTKKTHDGLKVLGAGELTAKLNITAAAATKSAIAAVEKAKGKLVLPEPKEKVAKLPKKEAK